MIQAKDLVQKQKEREKIKYKTFSKIYNLLEKKIILASSSNFYQIYYQVPEFIIGLPLYNCKECSSYLAHQLHINGFTVDINDSNMMLIKWLNE